MSIYSQNGQEYRNGLVYKINVVYSDGTLYSALSEVDILTIDRPSILLHKLCQAYLHNFLVIIVMFIQSIDTSVSIYLLSKVVFE